MSNFFSALRADNTPEKISGASRRQKHMQIFSPMKKKRYLRNKSAGCGIPRLRKCMKNAIFFHMLAPLTTSADENGLRLVSEGELRHASATPGPVENTSGRKTLALRPARS